MTLSAYFGYQDAPGAIDWLVDVLGFQVTMRFPDEQDGVAHAELRRGDAVIIVFSDLDGYSRAPRKGLAGGIGVYLTVAEQSDVDGVFAAAVDAEASAVLKPEATEWGNYRCRILDIEGYEWSFGTHAPGVSY